MTAPDSGSNPRGVLDDLREMRLPAAEWSRIETEVRHLCDAAAGGVDVDQEVTQLVFEARVQRRFQGGRRAGTLPPTKQTTALPWVGLGCGALVLAVGGALGGGPVLVAVALLGLFVFGIALAGSRVAHRRREDDPGSAAAVPTSIPPGLDELVQRLRRRS